MKELARRYKTVNYPIEVPRGDYCWCWDGTRLCQFFDNEGGHVSCELGFYNSERDVNGIIKAANCFILKEN